METGLIFGYANDPIEKAYNYHGINQNCNIQNNNHSNDKYEHPIEGTFVFTIAAYDSTHTTVLLEGEIILFPGTPNCTWRGFEYWPQGSEYYNMVFEFGDFGSGLFQLLVTYPD